MAEIFIKDNLGKQSVGVRKSKKQSTKVGEDKLIRMLEKKIDR